MPEPSTARVRPTPMVRKLSRAVLPALMILLLAACGSTGNAAKPSAASGSATSTPTVGTCPADSPAVTGAKVIATVDLDGDGTPDQVRLTASTGPCPGMLFAHLGDHYVVAQTSVDEPPIDSASAVTVPGQDGQLLVTRQSHPRGGFQVRLYDVQGNRLVELQKDGQPLVPFIATDVLEHPLSIDCGDGGLVVTEAVQDQPIGATPTWDVQSTKYSFDGGRITAGDPTDVEDNLPSAQLTAKYPQLVEHTFFASCRAG